MTSSLEFRLSESSPSTGTADRLCFTGETDLWPFYNVWRVSLPASWQEQKCSQTWKVRLTHLLSRRWKDIGTIGHNKSAITVEITSKDDTIMFHMVSVDCALAKAVSRETWWCGVFPDCKINAFSLLYILASTDYERYNHIYKIKVIKTLLTLVFKHWPSQCF